MFLMLLQEGVAVTTAPVLRAACGHDCLSSRTQGQPDGVLSCASDRFCAKSPDPRGGHLQGWQAGQWQCLLSLPADADNANKTISSLRLRQGTSCLPACSPKGGARPLHSALGPLIDPVGAGQGVRTDAVSMWATDASPWTWGRTRAKRRG